MDLSIIIPFYDPPPEFETLVCRLCDALPSDGSQEVLLIDNDPGTPPRFALPRSRYVRHLTENQPGAYAARNTGICNSRGRWIAFTDADCIPAKHWNMEAARAMCSMGTDTICAGRVHMYLPSDQPRSAAALFDLVFGIRQDIYVSEKSFGVTANLIIPRAIFDKIGLFDERLKSGGDKDFCLRAIEKGYSIEYLPNLCVHHPVRAALPALVQKVRRIEGGVKRMPKRTTRIYLVQSNFYMIARDLRTAAQTKLLISWSERSKVILVMVVLFGAQIGEKLRLHFGGRPLR